LAWQKKFNTFAPLEAPSPELVVKMQASYAWQSLQGQWVNQIQQFQTDLAFTVDDPILAGSIVVNQPAKIDWITCTVSANSQNVGILISADYQLLPFSSQFVPKPYQLPGFPYYISAGNILAQLGVATGVTTNINLGSLYIAGAYDSAGGTKGATFYVTLSTTIQQSLQFLAVETATFAGQDAQVSIGVQYKVQG